LFFTHLAFIFLATKAYGASYEFNFDQNPAENLPPAYGFCMTPEKKVHLYVTKQRLKNPAYRHDRNIYQKFFAQQCEKIKGKYMGGDSGVRQRAQTFHAILKRMPPEEAEKMQKTVYFDTRYHTLRRPNQLCAPLASGQCTDEKGYYPGNGQGLRFFKKQPPKK
jgi:hypothetical protein